MHSRIQIGSLNNRQFGTNKQTNKIGDEHLCPPPHPLRALPEFQLPSFFQRFRSSKMIIVYHRSRLIVKHATYTS